MTSEVDFWGISFGSCGESLSSVFLNLSTGSVRRSLVAVWICVAYDDSILCRLSRPVLYRSVCTALLLRTN